MWPKRWGEEEVSARSRWALQAWLLTLLALGNLGLQGGQTTLVAGVGGGRDQAFPEGRAGP